MGAEGPHADHKTARTTINQKGFCSWTIMQDTHTVRDTKEHIQRLGWETLDHPAYIPDLGPSDFHLFRALKSALSGRHVRSNEEVQPSVKNFLRSLGTDFYQDGFLKLISRCCISVGGDVEK
ncbi:hypothetical protein AVEN_103950-1 [Araneus ventricosus]|uniref:Histone-lysine N-methyltransferase SETMAR n=1 Tax=Araneus ventricosus TaxID=182803 RepID=A0A4Y2QBG9_ARAVE|nr:hypothetical protein AVEN_103950-1 [Araneus ventricosus]